MPYLNKQTRYPYLVLLPVGFSLQRNVAARMVRSYRTVSPLPAFTKATAGGIVSVALSLGLPPLGVSQHRLSVEPGLSSLPLQKKQPSDYL